jgi:sec-independent protein translocase protein TatB
VFNLGLGELAVILVIALIFLGPKMLPEIASGLGRIIREVRKATSDIRHDIELDDMIRGPLRELRDAATLPPEELKRRDEAKAARRKAEAEAEQKRQEAEAAARKQRDEETQVTVTNPVVPPLDSPVEVITAGGTMVANPPPSDSLRSPTPVPELRSPAPLLDSGPIRPLAPPPPPPPPPRQTAPEDATVIDLQAQLKASLEAKATLPGRPVPGSLKPPLYRPREDKKG